MSLVKGILKRERSVAQRLPVVEQRVRPDAPPQLMLMIPDAAGLATYHLSGFPSAKAAEYFIDSTLRGHVPEGAVLFWALTWQPVVNPDYGAPAEPLVIIRDQQKPVVYPFSFSDLESAFEFLRHEMNRGLDLAQAMVYWAVPARIEMDFWGRATVVPPSAPARRLENAPFARVSDAATALAAETEEETAAETEAATDRFLEDGDIAEVVGMVKQLVTEFRPRQEAGRRVVPLPRRSHESPRSKAKTDRRNGDAPAVEGEPVLDFPAASQRLRAREAALHAWGNLALAIDEALDAHVARQVTVKLAWNRLMRAIGEAIEVQARTAPGVQSPGEPARVLDFGAAWANGAAAAREAVTAARAQRMMRRAWLNISWTLEEAGYAYALERKRRSVRGWRNASIAIGQAVAAYDRYVLGVRRAWVHAGAALSEAGGARLARMQMLTAAWSHTSAGLAAAVTAARRRQAAALALHHVAAALVEALAAKKRRDAMVAAWEALSGELRSAAAAQLRMEGLIDAWAAAGVAFGDICRAYVVKQQRAIRAWTRIGDALASALAAKRRADVLVAAWTNAALALKESASARRRREVLLASWANAGIALAAAAHAKRRHDMVAEAWQSGALAVAEAAALKQKVDALTAAWQSAAVALGGALRAAERKLAAMRQAWCGAALAIAGAIEARRLRERAVAAWNNCAAAMAEAGRAHVARQQALSAWRSATQALGEAAAVYCRRQAMVRAWDASALALKEAAVAEAKLRIAQAGLDKALLAEVDRAVKAAVKAQKAAEREEKKAAAREADATVGQLTAATDPEWTEVPGAEAAVFGPPAPVVEESPLPDEEERAAESAEPETTAVYTPPVPNVVGLWKTPVRRWEPREEPFRGFESPPGRFFRRERDETTDY